jgi:hypothetical protein
MKMLRVLAGLLLLGSGATSAAAQGVTLEFQDGKVRLHAQNVSVSQILAEWGRRGRTTIVNGERVPGPAVSIELQDVSEQQALDIVLRGVSGYLVGARESAVAGASSFDRIYILPTSSRPTNASPLPPQQALQVQDDLDDDEPPPAGARGPNPAPGARLPREIGQTGVTGRPVPVPIDDEDRVEPENRPAPPPGNPFGVAPGTARPGVITPGPTTNRPNNP